GARHALEVVVLGDPVALVAPALGAPRELPRSCESLRRIAALGVRRQIQDGQGCLAWRHLCVPAGFPTSREWRNGKRQPEAAVLFSAGESEAQPIARICVACLPLGPSFTSNSTFWFSLRVLKPEPWISEKWAKWSSPPPSGLMKPKPLESLNHFTVPVLIAFPFWLIPGKPTGLGSASKGKQGGN